MSTTYKLTYPTPGTYTVTLAGLPSNGALIGGRVGNQYDNANNGYPDIALVGNANAGTSPANNSILEILAMCPVDGNATWPNGINNTDSNVGFASNYTLQPATVLAQTIVIGVTSNQSYTILVPSVAALFGGTLPPKVNFFFTHNTTVNWGGGTFSIVPVSPVNA